MAESAQQLSPDKRALLAAELAKRRASAQAATRIAARPAGTPPELSLAQRRLWLLDRMSPGRATYNATMTMRIVGTLDTEILRASLDQLVHRHEALRTVGVDIDGAPRAHVIDTGVRWQQSDADETTLPQHLRDDASEPFDLGADVLLRAHLYRLAEHQHVLILTTHHIATDGWSRDVLFAELTQAYNDRIAGREPILPELPVQYGDYARWQNEALERGLFARHGDYWRAELDGAELVLDLPTDFARTGTVAHEGSRIAMDGAPGSGDALRRLARIERATFFMAMIAAGGAFLSSLTDQDDIVLGSPVANRQQPELERLIGFFVNTVIFRVRLHGDPTFRELLQRCRRTVIESLAHQDMPFDRLVELINPVRVAGRNPLFQVNFRMQGIAPPPPQLTGTTVTRMVTETGASRFELAFGIVDQPDAVRGYLEHSSVLFRRNTVDAWQASFVDLVARVVDDPEQRMSQLRPLVRADVERRRDQELSASPKGRNIRRSP